jgi:hypothetical protein
MFKFTIRDTILATTTIAVLLGWCVDHRSLATRLAESETALAESETEHRNWRTWAEYLRGQLNGIKLDGKWLMPYRLDFSPDNKKLNSASRRSGGEWVAPAGTTIEWRQEWADLR